MAFLEKLHSVALGFGAAELLFAVNDTLPLCGNGILHTPGFSNDSTTNQLVSGNITRYYAINIPAEINLDPLRQWPVIIDYHGASQDGVDEYYNSQYYLYPQGKQYIAVYPHGVDGYWQGPSYADSDVDDVQFTSDLLDHINSTFCINSDRVYASGKSNGAGFVDTLACSYVGARFGAFAMAAAALYNDTKLSDCSYKAPIMEAHGTADTTIPYDGDDNGSGGSLPDIDDWFEWWGERNGCTKSNDTEDSIKLSGDTADLYTYSCDGNTNGTQHFKCVDMGHCWPSVTGDNYDAQTQGKSCSGYKALDFTGVVLDWFDLWDVSNRLSGDADS